MTCGYRHPFDARPGRPLGCGPGNAGRTLDGSKGVFANDQLQRLLWNGRVGDVGDEEEIRVTARQLRALSHPLRTRILGLLRGDGPATATTLAARLGESSGATSYHLRQLAAYGFIERDTGRGVGRERWWRSAHARTVINSGDFMHDPDTRGALDMFIHTVLDEHMQRIAAYVSEQGSWHKSWNDAADLSDAFMRLTPERSKRLVEEIHAVIDRYRDDASAESDDAEQVIVGVQVFPRHARPGDPAPGAGPEAAGRRSGKARS
jgi:DNA-binding transcriptional ArsR family regulator